MGTPDEFISEPITPVAGTTDARAMARGEPGLPGQFAWRERTYAVVTLDEMWKQSAPEGGREGAEVYLRRHYYRVTVDTGDVMTLYCERQARSAKQARQRWFLYTLRRAGKAED